MTSFDEIPHSPVRLALPRKRMITFLIVSVVFVAGGAIEITRGSWVGWAAVVFFGLGVIVFALQIIRPNVILLDRDGFETKTLFRRNSRREWEECSAFTPTSGGPAKLVTYSTSRKNVAALRAVNSAIAGGDEAVQAGYGGLNAAQLAQLLNKYRDAKFTS